MRDAVIVASSRTPLAKSHRGSFKDTRPDELAAHAIAHVLAKAPSLAPADVEEVILGCGQPHQSQGHNVARVAALRAGLPPGTAGLGIAMATAHSHVKDVAKEEVPSALEDGVAVALERFVLR